MVPQTPPPGQVLALVLASWTVGTIVLAAFTRAGGEVDPGHFKVVWLVSGALASVTGFWHPAFWALAGGCLGAFLAVYLRRDPPVAGAAGAGAVALLALETRPLWFAAAAAVLLGAVTNAMLLGHWHLNQPRLGTRPLVRLMWALWTGVAAFGGASAALLLRGGTSGIAVLGAGTALAFVAFTAVLTAMVTHLVRGRSIMSATGILYLEILLCFVAAFTGSLSALAPRPR